MQSLFHIREGSRYSYPEVRREFSLNKRKWYKFTRDEWAQPLIWPANTRRFDELIDSLGRRHPNRKIVGVCILERIFSWRTQSIVKQRKGNLGWSLINPGWCSNGLTWRVWWRGLPRNVWNMRDILRFTFFYSRYGSNPRSSWACSAVGRRETLQWTLICRLRSGTRY